MKKPQLFVFVLCLLLVGAFAHAAPNNSIDLSVQASQSKGGPKNPPLTITDVYATSTTASSTTILWTTNKEADSYVYYWLGTSTASTTNQVYDSTRMMSHSVELTELQASSTYSFFVKSTKPNGKKGSEATTSPVYTFTTSERYPVVTTSFSNPTPYRTVPLITKIGEIGGLNDPAGVNLHPNGNIYVADYHNDVVKVFDSTLNLIQILGSTRGSAPGQFSEPWDIAFDSNQDAYITDTNNSRVQVFDPQGNYIREFPTPNSAQGIAINGDDYVYVSGRQPEVFRPNGTSLGMIPLGSNYYPRNIALDEANRVLFSNWGNQSGCCTYDENNTLTFQQPNGKFISEVGLVYQPHFIDVDSLNRVWIADHTNGLVYVYDSSGSLIESFAIASSTTTENPIGLEVAGNKLYLTSQVTDKVLIYEISEDVPPPPNDFLGPKITSLSVAPTSTYPGGIVNFSVTAEDPNGIGNVVYDIHYPNSSYYLRPNCNFGGATSGTCTFSQSIDGGISPTLLGEYVIESVRAVDGYDNVSIYYPDGTVTGAFATTHELTIPAITIAPASFSDNFDDGVPDGWWLGYSQHTPFVDGNWRIEDIGSPQNGVLVQDQSGDHFIALVNDVQASSQTIETDLKLNDFGSYGGVTLWYQDDDHWVNVLLYPAAGLIRILEDGSTVDGPTYPFISSQNTWYNFKVVADSETGELDIYVNDAFVVTHNATTTHRYGKSGVNNGNASTYFDNFVMSAQ